MRGSPCAAPALLRFCNDPAVSCPGQAAKAYASAGVFMPGALGSRARAAEPSSQPDELRGLSFMALLELYGPMFEF